MKRKLSLFLVLCLLLTVFPMGGLTASAATGVDVQFMSMDTDECSTYFKDNNGTITAENYTEGGGAFSCVTKDAEGSNNFHMYASGVQNAVDITGATHMIFDLWCERDGMFDTSSGWSDLYVWTKEGKDGYSWDGAQPNAIATAGKSNSNTSAEQNNFRANFHGLKAGWNTVVIPLDAEVTNGAGAQYFRLRVSTVASLKLNETVIFDDFRFVSQDVLEQVVPVRAQAKQVIALFAKGMNTGDVTAAMAAYEQLSAEAKAYVPSELLENAVGMKTNVNVQFRNMDQWNGGQMETYYHENTGYTDNENYLEGTGSIRCLVKEDSNDLTLFLRKNGTTCNVAGAQYLTFDLWVPRDNYYDGASLMWTDMRADDAAHPNNYSESYTSTCQASINTDYTRKAFTGLKAGWNHMAIQLDQVTDITDLVSLRLRVQANGQDEFYNVKKGDLIYFDDFRFISADVYYDQWQKINAAKDVTVLIRSLPAAESLSRTDYDTVKAVVDAFEGLSDGYESYVIGADKLMAVKEKMAAIVANDVDVPFMSMDTDEVSTYYTNNDGKVITYNYTQGDGAFECVAKEDGNTFTMYAISVQTPVDITGAQYMTFDLWVPRDGVFDGTSGWSDLYVWSAEGKGSLSWDGAQPYALATAGGSNSNKSDAQKNFRACFEGLKAGWNHIVIPLDSTVTDGKAAQYFRLRIGNVPGTKQGDVYLFDDFRFVNQIVLDEVAPVRNRAKAVIALMTQGIAKRNTDEAKAAYAELSLEAKRYIPDGLLDKAMAIRTGVDVQFASADTDWFSTFFADNDGTINQVNYTEGSGAYQCVAKENAGQNQFFLFASLPYSVDISGAYYMSFNLWLSRDGMLDGTTGWTDLYVYDHDTKSTMDWDQGQAYAVAKSTDQAAFKAYVNGLKAGWNRVVIPLDDLTMATNAQYFRLRWSTVPNMQKGDVLIFDDFRFVSADVATQDTTHQQVAFSVIHDIAEAYQTKQAADLTKARNNYDGLSHTAKQLVANLSVLELLEEARDGVEGITFASTSQYRIKNELGSAFGTVEATLYIPERIRNQQNVVLGTLGSNNPAMNVEINGLAQPQITLYDQYGQSVQYVFDQAAVPYRTWTHLALVQDQKADMIHCYIDGERKQSLTIADDGWQPTTAFYLGGDYTDGNTNYFKGRMKSLAIYADARTDEEIRADRNAWDKDGLLVAYDMSGLTDGFTTIPDQSDNQNPVVQRVRWAQEGPAIRDYAYSFAFVGDIQYLNKNNPDLFPKVYNWLTDNVEKKKIQFVFGLGDITQDDTVREWETAMESIHTLDGVVPYNLIRGNHDSVNKFNQYVSVDQYGSTVDGMYGDMRNTYKTMTVGQVKYLLLTLDFGPTGDALSWADQVVKAHPDHNVIITTHSYMLPNRELTDEGKRIWEELINGNENVAMVVCGHEISEKVLVRQKQGEKGNCVTQILSDHQNVDLEKPAGMITMFYFSEDGRQVQVETYSSVQDQWFLDVNQFSFTLDLVGPTDEETAAQVVAQIDALNVQSLDDKPDVVAARTAYDELTDAQKGLVTNLAKLVDAEAKIAELEKQADQDAIDKAEAKIVTDQINALDVKSLDDKPAVVAAREAYHALTEAQKGYVTNLAKLETAEAEIARLEEEHAIRYGDVDGDRSVSATDALEVLKAIVGNATLTDEQTILADVDGDEKISSVDALYILKKVVGKIEKFPVEE
ncbi:MAG: metallophosphoesterase [Clostridia bacterium]|nr:metallophosphoesterase [Clostridia bacterium]